MTFWSVSSRLLTKWWLVKCFINFMALGKLIFDFRKNTLQKSELWKNSIEKNDLVPPPYLKGGAENTGTRIRRTLDTHYCQTKKEISNGFKKYINRTKAFKTWVFNFYTKAILNRKIKNLLSFFKTIVKIVEMRNWHPITFCQKIFFNSFDKNLQCYRKKCFYR